MQEAEYLIERFKVENIIINSGKINYLEKELIKKRKDVTKGYEGLQISCGEFDLIQLNEEYSDENIGSQIYYATNGNINILLTGDASIESELNLLNKYYRNQKSSCTFILIELIDLSQNPKIEN